MINMDVRQWVVTDTIKTTKRIFIKASQCCFVHHRCYDNWCALGQASVSKGMLLLVHFYHNIMTIVYYTTSHHAWVSFEATAEVYNEVHWRQLDNISGGSQSCT